MATDSQVTLNPSPDDDHPSLQHLYENMEQSKRKIFPAADYLTKKEIPTHFIPADGKHNRIVASTESWQAPESWQAQQPHKHTTTLGIYTDGSLTIRLKTAPQSAALAFTCPTPKKALGTHSMATKQSSWLN
jgi:hypothetical protein